MIVAIIIIALLIYAYDDYCYQKIVFSHFSHFFRVVEAWNSLFPLVGAGLSWSKSNLDRFAPIFFSQAKAQLGIAIAVYKKPQLAIIYDVPSFYHSFRVFHIG